LDEIRGFLVAGFDPSYPRNSPSLFIQVVCSGGETEAHGRLLLADFEKPAPLLAMGEGLGASSLFM
jgi:hypothetical protein